MNVSPINFKGLIKINSNTHINTDKIESIYTSKDKNSKNGEIVNVVTTNSSYMCPDYVTNDRFIQAYNAVAAKKESIIKINKDGNLV